VKQSESRVERWTRWYHLQGRGWAREHVLTWIVAAGVFFLLIVLHGLLREAGAGFGRWEWWTRQPAQVRYLFEGGVLEVAGWALVVGRVRKRGGIQGLSFWDVRMFAGEVAMIVGGLVFLDEGGRLI
jgi:hypothetical protein